MSRTKKNKENRKSNLPIFLLIVLLFICVFAGIYYFKPELLARPSSPAAEENAVPSPSATATVVPEPTKTPITIVTPDEIKSVLSPAAELITSKYYYTNAADFESVKTWIHSDIPNPFTRSKGYIIYDGVVSVGIDINELKYDVDNENKRIVITIPREKILAHEIDNSSMKSDTNESIFNNLDAEYYAQLIDGLQKGTEEKVLKNAAYLKEVRRNTEIVLRNFLLGSELTRDYSIQFKRTVRLD